jgi:hypothetical protein
MGSRLGTTADDYIRGLGTLHPGVDESGLANIAEDAVSTTRWLDDAIARIAAERARTSRVVRRSTCEILDRFETLVAMSEAESASEIQQIIRLELQAEQLVESDEKILEVYEEIVGQIDALSTTGTIEADSLATLLLCIDV